MEGLDVYITRLLTPPPRRLKGTWEELNDIKDLSFLPSMDLNMTKVKAFRNDHKDEALLVTHASRPRGWLWHHVDRGPWQEVESFKGTGEWYSRSLGMVIL
ncbi:hypothetical protein [Magnetococcus sp. PR-3]|uniref:hypothetical protein n=1 Tax=Magnetococcus sp. PR-3 TaxID=3120355 RepID=UPI002FCE30EC